MMTTPKYEWPNKLSFDDRQHVIRYYLQGYGLYHIATSYGVSTSTVEYHLKKASVFTPYKKPTLFGNQNPIIKKEPQVKRTLAIEYPIDNKDYWFDEFGERYLRPKSYKQLVNQMAELERQKAKAQRQRYQAPVCEKPRGFLLRVSLTTGNVIRRGADGRYEFSHTGQEELSISSSLISY